MTDFINQDDPDKKIHDKNYISNYTIEKGIQKRN